MSRVLVKICGLTRAQDVEAAVAAGADALGFVFAPSPRRLSLSLAQELLSRVPAGVMRVGLFLDQGRDEIQRALDRVTLDVLQFHGRESGAFCESFQRPYLKAIGMRRQPSLQRAEREYVSAIGLLLDSHAAGARGGTGEVFDWRRIPATGKDIWLAGGLNADNVGAALETVRPRAVDVSSGVESSPGIKDAAAMNAFVTAVRRADQEAGEVENR